MIAGALLREIRYPWLAANPNKIQLPATYEQAWVEYLLSFPVVQGGAAHGSGERSALPGGRRGADQAASLNPNRP
jgi:hypothetical protein